MTSAPRPFTPPAESGGPDRAKRTSARSSLFDIDTWLDVKTRQRAIRSPLVLAGTLQPSDLLELIQCDGQGMRVEAHLVLIQPGAQFVLILEPLTATFDGSAHVR